MSGHASRLLARMVCTRDAPRRPGTRRVQSCLVTSFPVHRPPHWRMGDLTSARIVWSMGVGAAGEACHPLRPPKCGDGLCRRGNPRLLSRMTTRTRMPGDDRPSALPDPADLPQLTAPPDAFLGVYYIETRENLHQTAEFIALEESAGAWSGGGEPTGRYRRSVARVLHVRELRPGAGYAAIAFPTANLPERGSPFAAVWLYLTAGPLFERPFADVVRLADVLLPDELLRAFRGPRFGVAGARTVPPGPPAGVVVGASGTPRAGRSPPAVAPRGTPA